MAAHHGIPSRALRGLLDRQDDRRCFRDYVIPEAWTNDRPLRHFCKRSVENADTERLIFPKRRQDSATIAFNRSSMISATWELRKKRKCMQKTVIDPLQINQDE